MATMLNHADGTGISAQRYKRLLECEECLLGLVDPVEECVKQVSDSVFPFLYPKPPDRYNIWTQMEYVVANLKDSRTFVDQENVHDAEYENWSLPGRIRVLARTRNHASTTDATELTITKERMDRLEEADRCLTGLLKPIQEAFQLAQGGTKYEPNGPEGEFDIWEIMKYIAAQLQIISKECEKKESTNNALKSASLSNRVSLLIAGDNGSAHANGSTVSDNAKPEGDELVEHFKGIFEKLYDEVGNLKDEVFKERVVELLAKVLPSNESTTTKPVDPRYGEIDPDV